MQGLVSTLAILGCIFLAGAAVSLMTGSFGPGETVTTVVAVLLVIPWLATRSSTAASTDRRMSDRS